MDNAAQINLTNLLAFIDAIGVSQNEFESSCGIPQGRLQESKGELTKEEYDLILKKYGWQLNELGFICVEGSAFNMKEPIVIIDNLRNQIT